jgi:hypothetical protein
MIENEGSSTTSPARVVDVQKLLGTLAMARPTFHSEGDFQHAFAWEMHIQHPQAFIRLEQPIETRLGLLHIDLTAEIDQCFHLFELKYKTKSMIARIDRELYELQNHGAQPLGRYDFLKDIARLESFTEEVPTALAHAILLTNDGAYWSGPRSTEDTSAAFSLYEARSLSGQLDWSPRTSAGTKRGREEPIRLRGQYRLAWRNYSEIRDDFRSTFRYLAVEVVRHLAGNRPQ